MTIPKSVTSIGEQAFYSDTGLKDIYYEGSEDEWKRVQIGSGNLEYMENATMHYNGTMTTETNDNVTLALSSISLSKASVTYNGKAQKPAVTVKDEKGQIVAAEHYTVTYTNNKKVGQATVTVTGKGNYTGTLTAQFNIIPKGQRLLQLKRTKQHLKQ